jgi:hypothetical protein
MVTAPGRLQCCSHDVRLGVAGGAPPNVERQVI